MGVTSTETPMLDPDVSRLAPTLATIRRTIHQLPEPAFEEVRTAALVAERLRTLGLDYPHHSPRFDFDEAALPIGVQVLLRTAERFLGA